MSLQPSENQQERILVIKLGALGDMIQALGPMAAIRKHHPNAHIT
ncbi:MAG: ADP-heptose--LPS heptosyltransferase, partial [Rhodospirillales bacterium]|nr:ADP-heptose--LPS heptosyltransferase [Rhodospirillales bacterium]